VPATRIILVDLGERLSSLLHDAAKADDDLVVVGEELEEVELLMHADQADLVIVGRSGTGAAAMAERLIDENPAVTVVAVDPVENRGQISRLSPSVEDIAPVGVADLIAVARRLAHQFTRWPGTEVEPS